MPSTAAMCRPSGSLATMFPKAPLSTASRIIEENRLPNGKLDLNAIAVDLKQLAKTNPKQAFNVYAEINSKLSPLRQGELQRLVGKSLPNPNARVASLNTGQHVNRAASTASDTLHSAAELSMKPKGAAKLAPLPAKIIFATVDAKMKYEELRAKGFTHGAAMAGMAAGQAASVGIAGTGTVVGGWVGGIATSPTGPGAIAGAGGGAFLGGSIAGGIDWAFGLSDKAALKAANAYDGRNIK